MALPKLERMQEVVNYKKIHGEDATLERFKRLTVNSLNRYERELIRLGLVQKDAVDTSADSDSCSVDISDKAGHGLITTISSKIKTVDDALKYADIDLNVWEPYRSKVNFWDVTMAGKDGEPTTETNYQVSVWVERKKQDFIVNGMQLFIEEIKKHAPNLILEKRSKKENPHLIEISIFDHHFGKLCWGKETGTDWDLEIARDSYIYAFMDLIKQAQTLKGDNIEKILVPLGQDFFHINDQSNKTPMAGNQLDVDGRLAKIFKVGLDSVRHCISEAVKIAPVDIVYSPGNHDQSTTYFLCEALNGYFYKTNDVSIDISPEIRKAYLYGNTFIGFAHWLKANVTALPTIFSTHPVYGELRARAKYREIQIGHLHKKDEISFMPLFTDGGIVVRRLPSLTGTDFWHYQHGFVGSARMAECYLFDIENGPAGYFPTMLRADKG